MSRGLFVTLVACAGCGGAAPAASESFLAALPSRQTLEVTAPTARAPAALSETSASALGETASLYVLTRQMTAQVNGIVGGALDTLGDITRTPPAAIGSDSAVWGPFTGPLSPVAARLLVTRVAPGSHRFVLELRPRSGQDSEFEPFLEGGSTGAAPGGPGQGQLSLDLDLAHRLDPVANATRGSPDCRLDGGAGRQTGPGAPRRGPRRIPAPPPRPTSCRPCSPTARAAWSSMPRQAGWARAGSRAERAGPTSRCMVATPRAEDGSPSAGTRASRGSTRRASRRTAGSDPRGTPPPACSANPCASVRHGPDAWHR